MQSQCSLNTLLGTILKEDKFAKKELQYTTLGRSAIPGGWYISDAYEFWEVSKRLLVKVKKGFS